MPENLPAVRVGEARSGELARGSGGFAGRERALAFELVPERGGPITLRLEALDFDARLLVLGFDGALLAEDDNGGGGQDAELVLEAQADRRYAIVVAGWGDPEGSFTLLSNAQRREPASPLARLEANVRYWERAASSARERSDVKRELECLQNGGDDLSRLGRSSEALELFERSLELAERHSVGPRTAVAHLELGTIHAKEHRLVRALDHLQAALELEHLLPQALVAQALDRLAELELRRGAPERAIALYERLLALSSRDQVASEQAVAHDRLALACWKLGDADRSREHHARGRALAAELATPDARARAHLRSSEFHAARGDSEACEDELARGLELAVDPALRIALIGRLGNLRLRLGDFFGARERFQRALVLARESGNEQYETQALSQLASVDRSLGAPARARARLEEALELCGDAAREHERGRILGELGVVLAEAGSPSEALASLEEALRLSRACEDPLLEVDVLLNLGSHHQDQRDLERALACGREALAHCEALRLSERRAIALVNLACAEQALGRHDAASVLAREASGSGIPDLELAALETIARAALAERDVQAARACCSAAGELLQHVGSSRLEREEVSAWRSRHGAWAEVAQDLASLELELAPADAREAIVAEAFEQTGSWKGRGLLEGIWEHARGGRTAEAMGLLRERREVLADLDAASRRVAQAIRAKEPDGAIAAWREKAGELEQRSNDLLLDLHFASARDEALEAPAGFAPEQVRAAVLSPDAVLLEFAEGSSTLFAYVLTPSSLQHIELGPRRELEAEAASFVRGLSARERLAGPADIARAGKQLFERLLAPALSLLEQRPRKLVLVPSPALSVLPFEALVTEVRASGSPTMADLRFVLDDFLVSYSPSSPVLAEIAARPPRESPPRALVLADPLYASEPPPESPAESPAEPPAKSAGERGPAPDPTVWNRLRASRNEALTLANLILSRADSGDDRAASELLQLSNARSGAREWPSLVLRLGDRADPLGLRGDLRSFSLLHFAAHGFIDADDPQNSGLALSSSAGGSGYMCLRDVLELDLDADLVVLSACDTAAGPVRRGEGVQSLARAFLYAGARSVVASLWRVDDLEASQTMQVFYEELLAHGRSPAEALRAAKLAVRQLGQRGPAPGEPAIATQSSGLVDGHPFSWAAFVYVGSAR